MWLIGRRWKHVWVQRNLTELMLRRRNDENHGHLPEQSHMDKVTDTHTHAHTRAHWTLLKCSQVLSASCWVACLGHDWEMVALSEGRACGATSGHQGMSPRTGYQDPSTFCSPYFLDTTKWAISSTACWCCDIWPCHRPRGSESKKTRNEKLKPGSKI